MNVLKNVHDEALLVACNFLGIVCTHARVQYM